MIVVMKSDASSAQLDHMVAQVRALGLDPQVLVGTQRTVIAAIGDERAGLAEALESGDGVDKVMPILAPYKRASAEITTERTVVRALGFEVGGTKIPVIAGPCSVENEAQIVKLASTDVTGLLTSSRTMVGLECLLAVAEVRGGVAFVGPLRLRSADGTIVARGRVDLLGEALDVTVASESATTGALALDVPMRVSGSFDDPTIRPAGSTAGRAALAGGSAAAPLRAYAQRSSCAR